MLNPKAFFDRVKKDIEKGGLSQEQVDGLNRLVGAFESRNWPIFYAAYALATSKRECGSKYQPVREGFKKTDAEARKYVAKYYPTKYGKPTVYGGQFAYGRGDVQLTWADPTPGKINNYGKADAKLAEMGLIKRGELLANFDLALRPDLSVVIMMVGMDEGWFTGKKNSDYLSGSVPDFYNARRIINGTDHASEIADNARLFLYALQDGGYGVVPVAVPPAPNPHPDPIPQPPDVEPIVASKPSMFERFRKFFS
jgi:putative chitinase